jgi:hypothetical protein
MQYLQHIHSWERRSRNTRLEAVFKSIAENFGFNMTRHSNHDVLVHGETTFNVAADMCTLGFECFQRNVRGDCVYVDRDYASNLL